MLFLSRLYATRFFFYVYFDSLFSLQISKWIRNSCVCVCHLSIDSISYVSFASFVGVSQFKSCVSFASFLIIIDFMISCVTQERREVSEYNRMATPRRRAALAESHWMRQWDNRKETVQRAHPNIIPTATHFVDGQDACFEICQQIMVAAEVVAREDDVVNNPLGQLGADDTGIALHYLSDAAEQEAENSRTVPSAAAERPCIAVNFESEGKQLRLITIATANAVFIISIEPSLFDVDSPLRKLLEHNKLLKLMFDCRSTAHVLLSAYRVRLRGVLDLQPMATVAHSPQGEYLTGLVKAFTHFGLFGADTEAVVETARQQFDPRCGGNYNVWSQRPLSNELLKYCALAAQRFFLAVLMMKEFLAFGFYISERRMQCAQLFTQQLFNAKRDFDFTNHDAFAFRTPHVVRAE
ncbi:3'-5' exonuclease, putative [Bodo saltans]|uniref:3'-5' exonuclease, putative n=1 Tax=Bodo saltans TaxID=75058 RepID=A0A0S4ITX0_BODSA|nr:3'-5' exonuclease, putative [Bodo saltans]|eukprot:CUF58050.1 3'-5' exonuclease, putative [Bodo saltans]